MFSRKIIVMGVLSLFVLAVYKLFAMPEIQSRVVPNTSEAITKGEYLVSAGGCYGCHEGVENKKTLSGGMALESDFGTFYVPNITPDVDTGIGGWQGRDFLAALKHGRNPSGAFYFPAFPYRSYAGMTDEDVLNIAAYLLAQSPVEYRSPRHDTPMWLSRWMLAGWNALADFLSETPETYTDPEVARGAYLARHLGHCSECHTPRNGVGILDSSREYQGAPMGDGQVDAIDPAALSNWSNEDFAFLLFLGLKPDGDYVGGEMEAVIEHNTSKLTDEDRMALAAYFVRGN